MSKKQEAGEPRVWCFDGSLPDEGTLGAEAWRAGKLFRAAWGRPVAASSGPEYRGYRGIRA